jgi:hypothetical protein
MIVSVQPKTKNPKEKGGSIKMKQYFLTSYSFKETVLIQSPTDNHDNFWLPLNNHMHIDNCHIQTIGDRKLSRASNGNQNYHSHLMVT